MFCHMMKELGVSIVIQAIFAGRGSHADIEIVVRERHFAGGAEFGEEAAIVVERSVEAGFEHLFGFRRRCAEGEDLYGPKFGIRRKKKARTFSPAVGLR